MSLASAHYVKLLNNGGGGGGGGGGLACGTKVTNQNWDPHFKPNTTLGLKIAMPWY